MVDIKVTGVGLDEIFSDTTATRYWLQYYQASVLFGCQANVI